MIGHRLNRTLTVYRPNPVADGAGGFTNTPASVGTIRVQASQPTAQERAVAQQDGASLAYVLHTSYGADVRRGDELDGDLPVNLDGRRLRVINEVSDSQATYLRLECEVTQGE